MSSSLEFFDLPVMPITRSQTRKEFSSDEMASSTPSTTESTPASTLRPIPLCCCVCPEKPRFSDVSHLLTHIASKGHLHHETQTKLKSHQDQRAAMALQQYDRWYVEYGIEVLLVERMRSKQAKEASKNKRSYNSPRKPAKPKKKARKASEEITVKSEEESYPDECIFPGFFTNSDADFGFPDDVTVPADALALKGQIWPGMGKMDLANEEMRRTRNQRKPKSVIERMRRASEGIEPTQVVMNTDFNVERVKGVYDDDSPVEDVDETTPPRKAKTRRKKPSALTEIPANVPRGDRTSRNKKNARASKMLEDLHKVETPTSATSFSQDVFRDEKKLDSEGSASPSQRDTLGNGFRNRLGLQHTLDPVLHSNLASPTPQYRDHSSHLSFGREIGRGKYDIVPYTSSGSPFGIGSFSHPDPHYPSALDGTMYHSGYRIPFAATAHYGSSDHEHYRLSSGNDMQVKHGDFAHSVSSESLAGSIPGSFSDLSGVNPLMSQDRTMLNHYHYPGVQQQIPGLSFTSMNHHHKERDEAIVHAPEQRDIAMGVKMEPQLGETQLRAESKDSSFGHKDFWQTQGQNTGLGLPDFHSDLTL